MGRASKLSHEQLVDALTRAAVRGGHYTEAQLLELFASQTRTLVEALSAPTLTADQRSAIIADFLRQNREQITPMLLALPDPEPTPPKEAEDPPKE